MFKLGDVIIGKENAPYVHTAPGVPCRVLACLNEPEFNNDLIVELCDPPGGRGFEYTVESKYFVYPDSNQNALLLLNKED